MTIDVTYQLVSATEIRILGTVPIVWADYKIPSPTFAGVADVRDNGAMEFLIVATRYPSTPPVATGRNCASSTRDGASMPSRHGA